MDIKYNFIRCIFRGKESPVTIWFTCEVDDYMDKTAHNTEEVTSFYLKPLSDHAAQNNVTVLPVPGNEPMDTTHYAKIIKIPYWFKLMRF